MINIINILGWLGNFGFLYGAVALAQKKISGWVAQVIANLFYVIQSVIMHNSPLFWLPLILIGVNIYGIYKWIKDKNETISIT